MPTHNRAFVPDLFGAASDNDAAEPFLADDSDDDFTDASFSDEDGEDGEFPVIPASVPMPPADPSVLSTSFFRVSPPGQHGDVELRFTGVPEATLELVQVLSAVHPFRERVHCVRLLHSGRDSEAGNMRMLLLWLATCPNLREAHVTLEDCAPRFMEHFTNFVINSNLHTLTLSGQEDGARPDVDHACARLLAEAVGVRPTLRVFDVTYLGLSDAGARAIMDELVRCPLRHVTLHDTNMSTQFLPTLAAFFVASPNPFDLDVYYPSALHVDDRVVDAHLAATVGVLRALDLDDIAARRFAINDLDHVQFGRVWNNDSTTRLLSVADYTPLTSCAAILAALDGNAHVECLDLSGVVCDNEDIAGALCAMLGRFLARNCCAVKTLIVPDGVEFSPTALSALLAGLYLNTHLQALHLDEAARRAPDLCLRELGVVLETNRTLRVVTLGGCNVERDVVQSVAARIRAARGMCTVLYSDEAGNERTTSWEFAERWSGNGFGLYV